MGDRPRGLAIGLLAGVALLVGGAEAAAHHSAPATYTGTHTGSANNSVELDVSADGTQITRFAVTNVPGNLCTFTFAQHLQAVQITNHAFSRTGTGVSFTGSFPSDQNAQGTLRVTSFSGPCVSNTFNWTATTNAPRAPHCNNGGDDDGDGKVDFGADPGCSSASDDDETDPAGGGPGGGGPGGGGPGGGAGPGGGGQYAPPRPVAALFGRRVQKARRFVSIGVACGARACNATAQGRVNVPNRFLSRLLRLRPARAGIPAGARRTLKLRVPAKTLRAIKRALRARRRVAVRVRVTVRNAAGNRTVIRRTIRLRR